MDDNVYADLLQQITADKQVVVKIGKINDNFFCDLIINDSATDPTVNDLMKLQLKLLLNDKIQSLNNDQLINGIAESLSILINSNTSNIDKVGGNNRQEMFRNEEYSSVPYYVSSDDSYYLTIAGIPIWLAGGTKIYFFPEGTDISVFGEKKRGFGMVWAFVNLQGQVYVSQGAQDKDGKILHDGFYEKVTKKRYYSQRYLPLGSKNKVKLGLLTECGIISIREVEMTVNYVANGTSFGSRIGMDVVKNDFFKYTELKFVKSSSTSVAHKVESRSIDISPSNVETIIFKTTCYKMTKLFESSGLSYIVIEANEKSDLVSQYYTQDGILFLTTDANGEEKGLSFYSYKDETFTYILLNFIT